MPSDLGEASPGSKKVARPTCTEAASSRSSLMNVFCGSFVSFSSRPRHVRLSSDVHCESRRGERQTLAQIARVRASQSGECQCLECVGLLDRGALDR
jgi:hypothetical protein